MEATDLSFLLGYDANEGTVTADLAQLYHLLISGSTGSGKTAFVDNMLLTLMRHNSPKQLRFVLCDYKGVDLTIYNGSPFLLRSVCTERDEMLQALQEAVTEGTKRLRLFSKAGVRTLSAYNEYACENNDSILPVIVVVIDDLAFVSEAASAATADAVQRIFSIGRTVGVHLVAVTQVPDQRCMRKISPCFFSKLHLQSSAESGVAVFKNGAIKTELRIVLSYKDAPPPDGQTIYFLNGSMYKVYPTDQDGWYDARFLVSDGELYDLENVEDIQRITIPEFGLNSCMTGYGVTGNLDYVLRMKAGSFYNRVEKCLCAACLWKATEMMLANTWGGWVKKDYYRLVYWLDELGMFDEADRARKFLGQYALEWEDDSDRRAITVRNAIFSKLNGSDLVAYNNDGYGCCEQCAAMIGRVYSVSGKNKVFPALPAYAKAHGNFHRGCRCMMSWCGDRNPLLYVRHELVDAVAFSNRPWVDDRTQSDKDGYAHFLQRMEEKKHEEEARAVYSYNKGVRRLEFEAIKETFPELAPKSLTGYSRMKTQRTKNFMRLYDLAMQAGISIDMSDQ